MCSFYVSWPEGEFVGQAVGNSNNSKNMFALQSPQFQTTLNNKVINEKVSCTKSANLVD